MRRPKKRALPKMAAAAPEAKVVAAAISDSRSGSGSDSTSLPEATIASEPSTPTKSNKNSQNAPETSRTTEEMAKSPPAPAGPPKEITADLSPQVRDLSSIGAMEEKFELGYDSDGQNGPFVDMEEIEGVQIFDENPIAEHEEGVPAPEGLFAGELNEVEAPVEEEKEEEVVAAHIDIHDDILSKMNVSILKEQLKIRGLKVTGKKGELLERLKKGLKDKVPVGGGKQKKTGSEKKKKDPSMKGFHGGSNWEPLSADEVKVDEPLNPSFKNPHAPTVSKEDAKHVPAKFNF